MPTEPKEKKPRTPRGPNRNDARMIANVRAYCTIKIEVLTSIQPGAPDLMTTVLSAQIEALEGVLKQLGAE